MFLESDLSGFKLIFFISVLSTDVSFKPAELIMLFKSEMFNRVFELQALNIQSWIKERTTLKVSR